MKKLPLIIGLLLFLPLGYLLQAQNLTAKEIVQKADDKMKGESSYSEMSMTIVRPAWQRTIKMKSWSSGLDYSLTLITDPSKEAGKTFLKFKKEMWSWSPGINRMVKLPPSIMSQGWMGSDFSNDELLKESSLIRDYTHKIISTEKIETKECYKIELTAKPDAAIVWSKQLVWITKDDFLMLKTEYYDEENYLVKTEKASKIRKLDDREIPTYFELIPEDEPGNKTIVEIINADFHMKFDANFFSQQNMKRVR